jgi:bifunctional ADP-heptose synthase (sugar kinase/adenylyltransferase)
MDNRRYVVLGDFIADLYYSGKKLIGVDGGSSRFNVIANLANMNCNTVAIGGCGNDKFGRTVLKRYSKLGVDISRVKLRDKPIRAYNLIIDQAMVPKLNYECSKISPVTYQNTWYEDSLEDLEYYKSQVNQNDIVVLDKLDTFSLNIIDDFECYKVLDIGNSNRLDELSDEQITALKQKISILQLNERVIPYLMQRFKYSDIKDIYNLFQPKLMIITKGREGADFFFENKTIQKKLINSTSEIDPTGAGDAFFSVFIREYFNNSSEVNEEFIHKTFFKASNLTANVVRHIGARGHIYDRTLDKVSLENDEDERE